MVWVTVDVACLVELAVVYLHLCRGFRSGIDETKKKCSMSGHTKAVLTAVFSTVAVTVGCKYAEQNSWLRPAKMRIWLSSEQPGGKKVRSSSSGAATGEDATEAAKAKRENAVEDFIVAGFPVEREVKKGKRMLRYYYSWVDKSVLEENKRSNSQRVFGDEAFMM